MKALLIGEIHAEADKELQDKTELQRTKIIDQESYPDVEAVILRVYTKFKGEEIAKFPNLKYLVTCSVGIDNLDLTALKERGIELIHCPGSNANSVAEHTLYFMLSLLREDVKKPYAELKGKTVGIIGLGHIGKLVARKLKGFEVRMLAFDVISQDPELLKELNVEMKEMDEVLSEADIVTIHVPYNKYTGDLINEEKLSKMKEGSFFINTSREEVVDNQALIKLQNKFRGIALDLYNEELQDKLDKHILLTDHVGAQGEESFRKMCVDPIKEFLQKIV